MTPLERQLKKSQAKVAELQKQVRLEKERKAKINKPPKKRGRPAIDENILIKAVQLAETKPLPHVAMRLNISLRTLYRYGIKRNVLNSKMGC